MAMIDQLANVLTVATMAYLVCVALLVGSFINLAADRLPRGESVVRPRSHCRSCARELNVVDLIPVGGWLLRRGQCATCGAAIGAASPTVEAICGGLMLAALVTLGLPVGSVVGAVGLALVGVAVVGLGYARVRA
jgi:prepilin signal peptidase PulO-like enzyme (type II secretory pathway)